MTDPNAPEPTPLIAALGHRPEFRAWISGLDGHGFRVVVCDDAGSLAKLLREELVLTLISDGKLGVDAGGLLDLVHGEAKHIPLLEVCEHIEENRTVEVLARGYSWTIPRSIPATSIVQSIRGLATRRANERAAQRLIDELSSRLRIQENWNKATYKQLEELLDGLKTQISLVAASSAALLSGSEGPLELRQRVAVERTRTAGEVMAELVNRARQRIPPATTGESRAAAARRAGRRPLRLDLLVEEVRAVFADLAEEQDVGLTIEQKNSLPEIWGDRTRLGQLLVNLLSNALRFTPRGGKVRIVLEHEPAHDGKASTCKVSVIDNGEGIPFEDQVRIFENGWSSTGRAGLGLAACKQIAAEHRAELSVESAPGHGANFSVALPIDPRSRQERATD